MKKSAATQWILVILLFISYQFAYNAQTLDATFSSPSTTQCSGGLFTLNATTSSYQSYSWTISGPNAFTSNLSGSSTSLNLTEAGTYNVSLTVSDGVTSETNSVNGYLTALTPAIANAGVDQTVCANSSVTLNGSVSGPATTIYWSGGMGTFSPNMANLTSTYSPSANEIANGFVNLILTTNDPVGPCPADQDTVMILFNSLPIVSAPASICVGSTEQLSSSSGGTWTSSNATISTINAISGLATGVNPGNVTFTFTNTTTGCHSNTSTVTVHSLPTLTLSSNTICVNSSIQINTNNQGNTFNISNPSVAWFGSNGITGIAEGTFIIAVMSPIGCMTTSEQISVTSNATVDSIPNQVYCAGDITAPITFSGSAQQYTWTNNNVGIGLGGSGANTLPGFTTINTTGINQVATITVTPVSSSCNATPTTFTITVKPLPTVNPVADQIVCHNQATQAIAFSGSTPNIVCAWNQNNATIGCGNNGYGNIPSFYAQNTSSVPQIAPFQAIPILNGCYGDTITFSITVNPNPTITLSSSSVCVNSTAQLTPSTGGTWVSNNSLIATVSGSGLVMGITQGTVSFSFTNTANGCVNTSNSLTVNPSSTVDPIPDQFVCLGELTVPIIFSGSAQQYNWTNDNVSIGLDVSGTGNIAAFTAFNNALINQVATITVTPGGNCNSTPTTFTITVKPMPTVFSSFNQTACHNGFTNAINFSGAINGTVYNWTNNNSSIGCTANGSGNIPSFIALNTTQIDQVANFLVTPSFNGCFGVPDTINITVIPLPTINPIADQSVCHNYSTNAINFSGALNGTDYNWTNNNSSIGCVGSGTGDIPSFQAQNAATFSQIANFVVAPSLNGCIGVADTFSITVNPLPIVNAGNDTLLCAGQSYTPIASGSPLSSYLWSNNVFNGVTFIPSSTVVLNLVGQLNGCMSSDSVTLTVVPIPNSSISSLNGEDSLACDGTLSVLVTDGSAPYSYTWTNGASNYTTAAIQNLCSGTYSLAVVDANGCSTTNSAVINDTLIPIIVGDTLIFTDNIYQDSTIIGADTSDWIENCTFDYSLVIGATIDSYIDNGDSTIVTWIVALSTGSTVSVEATYYMSPGTTGVYDLTLQLYCSAKSGPKFVIASSRLYYEASTIGLETHSLNAIYLYPNPTKSTLSISGINSNFSYKISDLQGKLLKQGANDKQIEIENLPTGTYVLVISTDNEVKQLRFVKL